MLNLLLKDKPMRWTRCVICILYFIPLLSWGKVAMAAVEFSPVPSCAEPVSSAVTGLHVNYLGASLQWPNIPDVNPPREVKALRLWDSYGTLWKDVQPYPNKWDFRYIDKYVRTAQGYNTDVIITLGFPPRWASSRPNQDSIHGLGAAAVPASLDEWDVYVRKVVTRYKGKIQFYEIWNEPAFSDIEQNVASSGDVGFFSGTSSDMAKLANRAKQIIDEIDPAAQVLSPPMTGHYQGLKRLDAFLKSGGAGSFDILSFHFYLADSISPIDLPKLISGVREVGKKYGFEGPIWNSESGLIIQSPGKKITAFYDGNGMLSYVLPESEAAKVMTKYLLLSYGCGVERAYWLSWDNGSMGLTYKTNSGIRFPNKAGSAFKFLSNALYQGAFEQCTINARGIVMCPMASEYLGSGVWVWSEDANAIHSYGQLPVDFESGRTMYGVKLVESSLVNGVIGQEPVFLKFRSK